MPILNYTTKVPVESTITELHKILAKAKANAIMTMYGDDGLPAGLSFRVAVAGQNIAFCLPVDVDGVTRALKADAEYRDDPHARRVAWRIAKDWVEAQMALIQAQMAELPQVFLPYAQTDSGETFYERIKKNSFLQIAGPKQ